MDGWWKAKQASGVCGACAWCRCDHGGDSCGTDAADERYRHIVLEPPGCSRPGRLGKKVCCGAGGAGAPLRSGTRGRSDLDGDHDPLLPGARSILVIKAGDGDVAGGGCVGGAQVHVAAPAAHAVLQAAAVAVAAAAEGVV